MFSTAHKHLLVPLASAPHSAYQVGVAPQETPRHSWDLVGYVKYVSRTLPGGSQLCKECSYPPLGHAGQRGFPAPSLHDARPQHVPHKLENSPVADLFGDQVDELFLVNGVEALASIGIHNPAILGVQLLPDLAHRVMG